VKIARQQVWGSILLAGGVLVLLIFRAWHIVFR